MVDTLERAQADGQAPWQDPVLETKQFNVYLDRYPVTENHTLIVPKYHTIECIGECFRYAMTMGVMNVETEDNQITVFNVGINMGESAGQTVAWPHVHLIFRRDGDMEDPRGGVRHVIPERGNYLV